MSLHLSSPFYIISKEKSKGQFKALQHICRKVNIIVLAFHSLSSNNLYGQSNELVESISLMRLCIQWALRFNQSLFTPSHSSSYLSPQHPFLSLSLLFFCIPLGFLLCGRNLVRNTYATQTGALKGGCVVKMVAMETQHQWNGENFFFYISFFFFSIVIPSFLSQYEKLSPGREQGCV